MNISKFSLLTLIFLAFSASFFINCSGEKSKPVFTKNDEQEIIQLLNQQATDWSSGNLEKFMNGYWKSDSLQFIKRKRIVTGWENTLENYKRTYGDSTNLGQLQFEILKLNPISDDGAFLTGKFYLTNGEKKSNGIFTLVFRKKDGRWVIVYDHTS